MTPVGTTAATRLDDYPCVKDGSGVSIGGGIDTGGRPRQGRPSIRRCGSLLAIREVPAGFLQELASLVNASRNRCMIECSVQIVITPKPVIECVQQPEANSQSPSANRILAARKARPPFASSLRASSFTPLLLLLARLEKRGSGLPTIGFPSRTPD